jgi:hypothetical protein
MALEVVGRPRWPHRLRSSPWPLRVPLPLPLRHRHRQQLPRRCRTYPLELEDRCGACISYRPSPPTSTDPADPHWPLPQVLLQRCPQPFIRPLAWAPRRREAVAKAAQQAERRGRSARGRAELARKVAIVKTMAAGCQPSCQPAARSSCWIRGEP